MVALTDATGNALTREGDVRRTQGDVAGGIDRRAQPKPTGSLVVQLDDGRRAVLPRSYVETSTSLGYALTVFRSQGITVDHTFGLGGDSLFQEAGYTQLSRGRLSNNLYVAAPENPRWEIGHHADDLAQRDALRSLVDALSQTREQTMAQDRLPTWPTVSADDLAAAYREHATLGQWLADHAPADVTRQLADAYLRAPRHVECRTCPARSRGRRDDPRRRATATRGVGEGVTKPRSRPGPGWTATSGVTSTGSAKPPPTANRTTRRPCSARFPSASPVSNGGSPRPGPSRPIGPAGTSPTADALGPEPLDPEQRAHWQRAVGVIGAAGFESPARRVERPDQAWLSSLWDRVHALDGSPLGSVCDMTPVPEPAPLVWSRDVDFEHDLDEGLGL